MKISLRYGRHGLSIDLPENADTTVIRKPEMPCLEDPTAAIEQAFNHPVDTDPLRELARGRSSACIAICDITRPVPNHLFLRPMIETLMGAGIPADAICVLVATGLHRPNLDDELAELVGDPWVLRTVDVVNHFARDDDQHVCLGTTSTRQTPVRLDRRFVEADLRIATGLVEPHFMAGYSGGRKVIAPGLAHAETITTFHSARFMSDPAAANCNFVGNPLHEEQLQIVKMLGGAFALNTVIDEDRRLAFVNFGEIIASHQQAVDFVRQYCEVPVPRRYQTVLTTAAGYPLDKTYYQTIKGMVGAMDILEPGGNLIIASECSEGLGSEEFVQSQRQLIDLGSDAFLAKIMRQSHAEIDQWQTQMQLKPQSIGKIHLFAQGLSDHDFALTGVQRVRSLDATLRSCLSESRDRSLAVIPEGPYVAPFPQA
ncbi:MAG: nickel-dependent lactate racemase [Pirellulaceae bacterium]